MKSGSITEISGYFVASCDITINDNPSSLFSLSFLGSGAGNTGISFSGQSGRLFDHSGRYFGNYRSGSNFNLTTYFLDGRATLFYNESLCCNDLFRTSPINGIKLDGADNSKIDSTIYF